MNPTEDEIREIVREMLKVFLSDEELKKYWTEDDKAIIEEVLEDVK